MNKLNSNLNLSFLNQHSLFYRLVQQTGKEFAAELIELASQVCLNHFVYSMYE